MTAINFPAAPAAGATHAEANITWTFDGTTWDTTGVDYVSRTSAVGAAMLPSGTTADRPGSPVIGATRWNATLGYLEVYTGSANGWNQLEPVPLPKVLPADMHISSNTKLSDGTYYVNDLTVDAGVTVTSETQALVFICTGNVLINGTIDLNGKGPTGAGYQTTPNPATYNLQVNGEMGGGLGGGGKNSDAVPYTPFVSLVGSAGGTGHMLVGSSCSATNNSGGAGGGGILIRAYGSITINASGILTANGHNADRGAAFGTGPAGATGYQISGSGGGSGGTVCLRADGPIVHNGTISVAGGAGAAAYASAVVPVDGGGGGGGGVVVTQSMKGRTGSGTIAVTGGAVGVSIGGATASGAAGGSNGGRGGYALRFNGTTGRTYTILPGKGEDGKILANGSPL